MSDYTPDEIETGRKLFAGDWRFTFAAGTFGALLFAPLRSLQQYGFAVTVGILLDTFVVRSLLVPSIAVLLGRHNWWPSRRAHAS